MCPEKAIARATVEVALKDYFHGTPHQRRSAEMFFGNTKLFDWFCAAGEIAPDILLSAIAYENRRNTPSHAIQKVKAVRYEGNVMEVLKDGEVIMESTNIKAIQKVMGLGRTAFYRYIKSEAETSRGFSVRVKDGAIERLIEQTT